VYIPLWNKTNYSFLQGASHPEELLDQAETLGLPALAVTDRDGVYGVVRAHVKARELGIKLLVGAEVTVEDGTSIVLLATDRSGYANLCGLLAAGRLRSPKGSSTVSWQEVCERAPGLLGLWGGPRSLLVAEDAPEAVLGQVQEAFGDRLYAMVARHQHHASVETERRLVARAARLGLSRVAALEVLYHIKARRPLHDVLTCIRHNVTLREAGTRTQPNAEHALLPAVAFRQRYLDMPDAIANTLEVASRCTFNLDALRYRYPSERLPDGRTTSEWLRELTRVGAHSRYGAAVPAEVTAQLARELALIEELDYGGYFLTMYEIVVYCRAHGILCQGRGSAANSAVCFCLGITAIDPVRMGLLFERFLSRERAEPPDIDLDIAHERREEVIQHVYARYGRTHAAMVANFIRYRPRSAVRDVGKALGIPQTHLLRLARQLSHHGAPTVEVLRDAGFDPEQPVCQHLVRLCEEILDFPRHLGIHPGGFLLGHEPIATLVPVENATMEGRTVIQWDKYDVEALGLFKVDLLGLGALTQLDHCFALLAEHEDVHLEMATLPPDDPATYDMLCTGDTVGVFQIESRAQMAMLPRLRPRRFYDLVIEISIVRPGPITGDMVHPYLRRRKGIEPVVYPHPSLEPVLAKTLGVPLFQEQVMKLAVIAADYSPGEADQLRRDMAAWQRSGKLEKHRGRLMARMMAKGIEPEFAERVFNQIRGFGEYGFPESHAASFALISYATSWLKRHHPAIFTCALLNAQPMGFYSASTIVEDVRRHGVEVLPIDVLGSSWECTLHRRSGRLALRMGLRYVKGLGARHWARILALRRTDGITSLEQFVRRTDLDEGALVHMAEAGAFESLGVARREALWTIHGLLRSAPLTLPLFDLEPAPVLPSLSAFEEIAWDYRRTHHSPRGHPLALMRAELRHLGFPTAEEVRAGRHGHLLRYAGLVICRQRPGTASGVVFLTMEDETGFVNVVLWPDVYARFARVVKTTLFLGLIGRLQVEDGVTHLIAERVFRPEVREAPDGGGVRNFH